MDSNEKMRGESSSVQQSIGATCVCDDIQFFVLNETFCAVLNRLIIAFRTKCTVYSCF
jgi:hypothetical protein